MAAIRVECGQETHDSVWDFVGGAAIADRTGDRGDLADAAPNAKVVGVDEFSPEFYFLAFNADVGDPVLAAGVRAASDVNPNVILEVGEALFELLGEPAGEGLGFGKC